MINFFLLSNNETLIFAPPFVNKIGTFLQNTLLKIKNLKFKKAKPLTVNVEGNVEGNVEANKEANVESNKVSTPTNEV